MEILPEKVYHIAVDGRINEIRPKDGDAIRLVEIQSRVKSAAMLSFARHQC